MSKLKPFFFTLVGFFAACGLLSFSHVGPASAQSPGVNLAQLVAQVNSLQSTVNSQATTISSLQSKQTTDEQTINSQATTINNLKSQEQNDIKNTQNQEQSDIKTVQNQEQTDYANLNGSVIKLQTLTSPLSLSSDPNVGGTNTLLTIKGVNVQIVDGNSSGLTDDGTGGEIKNAKLTGLGNLIIGYNATGNSAGDVRKGSHNLILGDQNNYGSFGSLVAGQNNTVSGAYASVSGGYQNTASGYAASVSGGVDNTASYYYASVTGGEGNVASSFAASVSGGSGNTSSSYYASVSGGENITQINAGGWSGGSYHAP